MATPAELSWELGPGSFQLHLNQTITMYFLSLHISSPGRERLMNAALVAAFAPLCPCWDSLTCGVDQVLNIPMVVMELPSKTSALLNCAPQGQDSKPSCLSTH